MHICVSILMAFLRAASIAASALCWVTCILSLHLMRRPRSGGPAAHAAGDG
jgi:hypothetical protein